MSTLNLDIEIDASSESSLKAGALQVLKQIRPIWKDISFKIYTDGITNKLIGAWNDSNKDDQILIRVYGENTELFINRRVEANNIKILYKNALAPELFACFKNGISYGFVHGTPLTTDTVHEDKIWKSTAEQMANFHKVQVDLEEPCLFKKLNVFYNLLPKEFSSEYNKRLSAAGFSKSIVKAEIDELRGNLTLKDCNIVFSHNDILLANIVWNETKNTVRFIDYEYGAPNYQPFDIGNHFNEYAGVENINYNLYPNEEFQKKWIRHYLRHFHDHDKIDQREVDQLYITVNEFSLASHLFWGTWAMLQAVNSSIDFDFLGYAIKRLQEYQRRKPSVFKH